MQIIPVLDIKGGLVVRGMMGDRANYRPIKTPLSATAEPLCVARGLAGLAPFGAFYVADLDAIEGRDGNLAAVSGLTEAFPPMEIWLDAGVRTPDEAKALLAMPRVVVVLGSETVESVAVAEALAQEPRVVLSLDYRGEAFMGPPALEFDASLWPRRVIAMTLAKVGSGAGPDLRRLHEISQRGGGRAVFAAGGVRDAADLRALSEAGIAGALVASALHDGRLGADDLQGFGSGGGAGS